jgi:cytochrome c biogenesis protein CcdA
MRRLFFMLAFIAGLGLPILFFAFMSRHLHQGW